MTGLVLTLVKVYQSKGVLSPGQKNFYNITSTVLIVALGLSFFVRPLLYRQDLHSG